MINHTFVYLLTMKTIIIITCHPLLQHHHHHHLALQSAPIGSHLIMLLMTLIGSMLHFNWLIRVRLSGTSHAFQQIQWGLQAYRCHAYGFKYDETLLYGFSIW